MIFFITSEVEVGFEVEYRGGVGFGTMISKVEARLKIRGLVMEYWNRYLVGGRGEKRWWGM